jgi:hypothetical protein
VVNSRSAWRELMLLGMLVTSHYVALAFLSNGLFFGGLS